MPIISKSSKDKGRGVWGEGSHVTAPDVKALQLTARLLKPVQAV
jgi:hypothetical protein